MHHIYTGGKGDPLCPLGFHPQVRWPTRCKRCFRDYKEHGGKGKDPDSGLVKDDKTRSTPSLSSWNSTSSRTREDGRASTSTLNESGTKQNDSAFINGLRPSNVESSFSSNKSLSSSSSWTSTPDLGNLNSEVSTTVSLTLPRRRRLTQDISNSVDAASKPTEFTIRRRSYTTDLSQVNGLTSNGKPKTGSETSEVVKPKLKSTSSSTSEKPIQKKSGTETKRDNGKPPGKLKKVDESDTVSETQLNPDVEFILRVKSSKPETSKKGPSIIRQTSSVLIPPHTSSSSSSSGPEEEEEDEDDNTSTAGTETTETTLVGKNDSELQEEVESLRNELELMKARCERVEREKSDILLRRLASLDTTSTKTAASEVLKLQQKVNELSTKSEDLKDDNKSLSLRVKELEKELDDQKRTSSAAKTEDLQAKLAAAETLCEELMDENEEMKKELRELEDEIEEMQDNFREDQADEYSSLKKELEQTTKNCRILSFKLRKAERKAEQLETEKTEAETKYKEVVDQKGVNSIDKIKRLEGDLKVANDLSTRLKKELDEANKRLNSVDAKGQPGNMGNTLKPGGGEVVSRASLTRGGSQEDPQQLLRDLQDSLEREADLREQLRFAEEEAANLRKKAERVEEDNDSLSLQLKKMATKAKTLRRSSPSTNSRAPRAVVEKDEGISDEDDPAELRVLLELNEQESAVLRKKVEDLETDSESQKKKIKELEDRLSGKKVNHSTSAAEETILDLRKKLVEKEKEIERLEREGQAAATAKKGPRAQLVKSQSLDSPTEQKALDTKRQLQLVEQEATILRTKLTTLEADNEKLTEENKKLQILRGAKKAGGGPSEEKVKALESKLADSEKQVKELKEKLEKQTQESLEENKSAAKTSETVDKLKKDLKSRADDVEKLTKENKVVQETLKRLRDDAVVDAAAYYKSRKPKKPTDLTTKLQLKKMVEDLETEIGDVLVVLKKSQSAGGTTSDVRDKDQKIKELEEKIETERKAKDVECKKMEDSVKTLKKEKESWKTEKKNLETEIDRLNLEKKNSVLAQDEISIFAKKLESTSRQLDEERESVKTLKKQLEDRVRADDERAKLEEDATEKANKISELEKKATDVENKLRKAEKNLSISRGKVARLEKNVEDLTETNAGTERKFQAADRELSDLKTANKSLNDKIVDLEDEIKRNKDVIKNLEETIRKEREKATDEHIKAGSVEKKEITALREDLSKKSKELDEANEKIEKLEKSARALSESHKKAETDMLREKNSWEAKASELESNLNAEKRNAERVKVAHEKEQKNREMELSALKAKIRTLEQATGVSNKKMTDMKDEWTVKVHRLDEELIEQRKKYDDLTTKYELLEEEHVVTKAQLVMEKEQAQNQLAINKKEITTLEVELKSLQDTLSSKQEVWTKERKELQEKVRDTTQKAAKASEAKWDLEKTKLQALNDEQKSRAEQLRQQNESMVEQMDHMRKENEELRKKLDDFDKVSKIQRQMSADSNQLEQQLREAQKKLAGEEKNHKSELAALKLRYESRVNLITGELQASQNHLSRFKRERDSYKHMLEEAQTQMANLKRGSTADSVTGELKDSKTAMALLEQQVSCMEDELSEARLESSKLKTELVSQKSAWEVKLSELQSKVNELEEEKILSSGRTKVVGLRTKMELAWQKEREDQQRLLQETSALARDLRQTLYEVERERDKIKLESKRIQEQIKRTSEEEMEENRKKITELQCDLLELRDAHAKLRTTNEKLRRETERWTRENRSLQRSKARTEEEERKVQLLLDNIDLLLKASFEKKTTARFADPSQKKRSGSKSRETSPLTTTATAAADTQDEIHLILKRLSETAEDIRSKSQTVEERPDDRTKRASSVGVRSLRAGSTESEQPTVPRRQVPVRKGTLHRKSISLSDTTGPGAQDQVIWRDDDNDGSLTSLEEHMSSRLKNIGYRENSMDSRLSGGSTQSELIQGDKNRKKKGLLGKLKKLTKSRSVEDPNTSQEDLMRGGESDSDVSTAGDLRGSKKDLKGKLADMFKRDAPSKSMSSKPPKKSDDRKSQTLPRHVPSSASSASSVKTADGGRPLDKARNPAASLLHKP